MPLYAMKEIWTPLRLVGVKLFKTLGDGDVYIKVGDKPRRKMKQFS